MKKLLGTLFAATLVLSACSQDDTKEDENKNQKALLKRKLTIKKIRSLKKKRILKKTKIINLHKKIVLLKNKTQKKMLQMNKFNLKNLQLKSNNKHNKLVTISKMNKDMTMTIMAFIELLLNKEHMNNGLTIKMNGMMSNNKPHKIIMLI